ncbi:cytochrome P450 4C1-like [Polistes fuscatus]|uniref:cytochrome P450 4C1-like n=1 Tax=Polistes fuscatus TaxID=30207 RepID=UPI001CA9C5E6|nr:cytochrome P450 4C1-like [Polistes fuscatus]
MVKKLSGPKAYPLIGNLNIVLDDVKKITHKLIKLPANYSSPWLLWLGPKLVLIFDDPESIEFLSKSSNGYEKSSVYDFMKFSLGNGVFTAPASIWEIHRKILNPVFKEKMVSTYVDSIVKNSNRLNNILETSNGKNIDFMHYVHLYSLLESDLNLQSNPDCKLVEYVSKMFDITTQRVMKFWLHPNIIFNNSSNGKRLQEYLSHINKITSEGTDTAANTLSFLFLTLATFPDIQVRTNCT